VSAPLLLHVGYHKTATSWMQQRLFVPGHGYAPLMDHSQVDRLLVRPHGLEFDPGPARALIAERRAEAERAHGPGLVPVISSELLSGHPFYGGRESDDLARRLALVAPDARVLISIRAQRRILPSVYMQYLLRGGTMTPAEFFAGEATWGFFGFSPVHFEYDRLVALYHGLFGGERVHLIQQEAIAADMDAAAAALAAEIGAARFEGLDEAARAVYAPSYPEHAVWALRRVNQVQASVLNPRPALSLGTTPAGLYRLAGGALRRAPLPSRLADRRPVSEEVSRRFAGRFAASNARLAALHDRPLDLARYDVEPL
jgi:hypothetical protein